MGIIKAFKTVGNWLTKTPEGIFTTGLLYGATIVTLWCSVDSTQKRQIRDAFDLGVNAGYDFAKDGQNIENMGKILDYVPENVYLKPILESKPRKILHKPRSKDYGAKSGVSRTIDACDTTLEGIMVQAENIMVQSPSEPETLATDKDLAQNT